MLGKGFLKDKRAIGMWFYTNNLNNPFTKLYTSFIININTKKFPVYN